MQRRRLLQALAMGATQGACAKESSATAASARTLKVLRLAFPTPESSLDPPQTNSDAYANTLLAQILEAPLAYDYLARPVRLVPQTAASMPEISPDGMTFTVRLRPGIFFSDDPAFGGRRRELVAQDYVYAIKRFYDPRYNSGDLYQFESLQLPGLSQLRQRAIERRQPFDDRQEVEGVRALDRYTFRIQLGRPDPRFIWRLADAGLVGAVAREVVEHYGDGIGAHPVGTGPFRLKHWRRGSQIVLERSPTYRGAVYEGQPADDPLARAIAASLAGRTQPFVDEVHVDIVEESQPRWLSFLNGTYHWLAVPGVYAPTAVPGGQLAPFLRKRGVSLQRSLQPDMVMSYFYMDDPLVGGYQPHQVALRRAIGLAFDGPGFIEHVLGGQAVLAQSTIAPFTSGFDPAYRSEMSTFDPARAKAVLDVFGYIDRNGDGWRERPDGTPLVLRMATQSSQRDRLSNELWRRCMQRVGLRMEFEVSTWPELLKKSRAGGLMMWGYSWTAGSPDGGFFLSIAYGPHASESNDPRFRHDPFDRLYEQQLRLPDGPEREATMRQAKDMLNAYMPYKVHGHSVLNVLVQPWTHHYWRHPFMRDVWRFIDVSPHDVSHPPA